jgi:hypothetical protein
MGLDQYAWAVKPTSDNVELSDFDFDGEAVEHVELAYWRKHSDLQGWMENLYLRKCEDLGVEPKTAEEGGWFEGGVMFNCVPLRLTRHDLANLEEAVRGEELPHTEGFFFGESHPEDKADDLRFIKKAHKYLDEGYTIYYYSWW